MAWINTTSDVGGDVDVAIPLITSPRKLNQLKEPLEQLIKAGANVIYITTPDVDPATIDRLGLPKPTYVAHRAPGHSYELFSVVQNGTGPHLQSAGPYSFSPDMRPREATFVVTNPNVSGRRMVGVLEDALRAQRYFNPPLSRYTK